MLYLLLYQKFTLLVSRALKLARSRGAQDKNTQAVFANLPISVFLARVCSTKMFCDLQPYADKCAHMGNNLSGPGAALNERVNCKRVPCTGVSHVKGARITTGGKCDCTLMCV